MAAARRGLIAYADGVDSPRSEPGVVARVAGVELDEVLLGWTPEDRDWLASASLQGRTMFAGYASAESVGDGRLQYLPVRLSAMPRLLADVLRPQVAVVAGLRRRGELVFGGSVGWGWAAAQRAQAVVVEIAEDAPDLGGPAIPGNIVATVPRPSFPRPVPTPRPPDAVDYQIGRHVVSILPESPTLQCGPGGVADAIWASLDRPAGVWSGLVTDAVGALEGRGLLIGQATTAYTWGGQPVWRMAAAGKLRLVAVDESHDLGRLSAIERFVACNTALQVSLDGSVNVERVGGRWVGGIGGHADFCAGAVRSLGGLSIIALRSTTKRGASTIVPHVEVVSTPRCDVEVVVTEHGVADLRGVGDAERARRITAIAAPQHRTSLGDAAQAEL